MIAQLTGLVVRAEGGVVVLDVNGVGYLVYASAMTLAGLPDAGGKATLLTHLIVREDELTLYGFASQIEQQAFKILIGVSGVGPKVALALLSTLEVPELARALSTNDTRVVTKVPGVGPKLAQRLCLELGDKMSAFIFEKRAERAAAGERTAQENATYEDAIEGLVSLGYGRADARRAVDRVFLDAEDRTNASALINGALSYLPAVQDEDGTLNITKAVITAAAPNQRTLPLQTLIDRDGTQKSVLGIILGEAHQAGIRNICVVVHPGDEAAYREAAGEEAEGVRFVPQAAPRGYGHAVYCARDFVGGEPFLHMIGDHVYVSEEVPCARQLVETAQQQACAVSGVQATRENLLPYFGAVGGQRVAGSPGHYRIECVLEKPTPTEAEQSLLVPGLRAGHYLCFFGMHVLTPAVMEILERHLAKSEGASVPLSPVLHELAGHERYLAYEAQGRRYPVDARYGLLTAQLALALSGQDRDEVLTALCELLAQRRTGN